MRWLIVCLPLLICACTSAPSAPIEVTRIVEVTRMVEVTRLVEVMVTPMLSPTTQLIAILPTATPQPLPDGWSQYALLNGEAIIAYPPGWSIASENVNDILFDTPMSPIDTLSVMSMKGSTLDIAATYEELLRNAKVFYLNLTNNKLVTFYREGSWDIGRLNAYFTATITDSAQDDTNAVVLVVVAEGDRSAILYYLDGSLQTIPDSSMDALQQIAQNIQFINTLELE